MADRLRGGTLFSGIGAPPPPNRAVVSDDGHRIRVSVYVAGVEAPLGVAELPLELAARLAADLAGAVAAHLARERNHRGPAQ